MKHAFNCLPTKVYTHGDPVIRPEGTFKHKLEIRDIIVFKTPDRVIECCVLPSDVTYGECDECFIGTRVAATISCERVCRKGILVKELSDVLEEL